MLITDSGSGTSLGASFLAATSSSTISLTASTLNGSTLSSLTSLLTGGQSVLSGWTLAASGYTAGNPAYLSLSTAFIYPGSVQVWSSSDGGTTWSALAPERFDVRHHEPLRQLSPRPPRWTTPVMPSPALPFLAATPISTARWTSTT